MFISCNRIFIFLLFIFFFNDIPEEPIVFFQMAVIKPENNTILLMVPDCSLTYQLGECRFPCKYTS